MKKYQIKFKTLIDYDHIIDAKHDIDANNQAKDIVALYGAELISVEAL